MPGWIQCSERLPTRDSILPCWVLRYSLFHDSYYVARDIWVFDRWAVYPFGIIAWMNGRLKKQGIPVRDHNEKGMSNGTE